MKAATIYSRSHIAHYTISIHAAREGGDAERQPKKRAGSISIHAAREGGDYKLGIGARLEGNFNPRRP